MDDPASYFIQIFYLQSRVAESVTLGRGLLNLIAVLVMVAANAFFVGAEFALVSVRRPRLEARARAGSKSAQSALRLLSQPTLFISATQLGITIASLALGWLGEPTLAALMYPLASDLALSGSTSFVIVHGAATVTAFSAITFLHIVLGELMPKMIALERAESLAIVAAQPLEIFAKIFRAPLWVFNKAGAGLGHLIGLKSTLEYASVYTESELRQLVDISRERGHLRQAEQSLIHNVFEFSDTIVREAMVPRTSVAAIPSTYSLEQIAEAFRQYGYSRLPVYRASLENVLGFVHSKDLMPYLLNPSSFRLEQILQAPLYIVDTARLEDVLRRMQKAKAHFGFVVDEHGGLEGVITLEDLLEELVGEISDEHDEVSERVFEGNAGVYTLDGGLAVRELNRRLNLTLPESDNYTTVAGLLMSETGRILKPGDIVKIDGFVFQVERVDRRRITRVRLEQGTKNSPDEKEPAHAGTAT